MSESADTENSRVDALLGESRPALEASVHRFADIQALRKRWEQVEPVPVIVESRGEGCDHSWAGLDIRTMLRGEQSTGRFCVHNVEVAPGAGLPAHYQEDVHTCMLVLQGEVELRVGKLIEQVGQYSMAYVPPRTRQSFRNRSDAAVTLALIYSPAGAERAFAAAHAHWKATHDDSEATYVAVLSRFGFRFDAQPLENDERTNATLAELEFEFRGPGDLEKLRSAFFSRPALPRLIRTTPDEFDAAKTGTTRRKEMLKGDDSGGYAMVNLLSGLPGMMAPPHHQPTEEEFFFIAGGSLQLTCATETAVLGPGAFAFCPRNCTHAFVNPSLSESVQFLTLNSPAGHERAMAAVRLLSQKGATKEELHALSVAGGFVFHSVTDLK